ncbi:hypothetical protein N2152v2_004380 [Parachlorella kessleri]
MSIFKKRTLKPGQLETLRKLEAEQLEVGRVLFCKDSIAIVEGLNNDADVGTALSFASGAKGVLLWRRSDNIVFALLLGGADLVVVGDGVECKVKGILQVVDDTEGPTTKRDYAQALVPVGEELVGKVVDYIGRPLQVEGWEQQPQQHVLDPGGASSSSSGVVGSGGAAGSIHTAEQQPQHPQQEQSRHQDGGAGLQEGVLSPDEVPAPSKQPLGLEAQLPLLNQQVPMERREQINQPLMTGVKAVDVLTPIGRGQSQLVAGPRGSGKTQLCIDAILGQRGKAVRCVYAATNCTPAQLAHTVSILEEHGALEYTTVVGVTAGRPLGEQFAALLMACCVGEAVRDAGGHSLVVLNDISPMVRMWEEITIALAGLGPVALELERDSGLESLEGSLSEDDLVEYEGMLVSVAAAQRRRFFSSLLQRAAKVHRRLKGGSMTLLSVAPGLPASGEMRKARETILKYRHLSEEQKAKLLHALEAKSRDGPADERMTDELRTEVVEEMMSIADGQAVLRRQRDGATGGVTLNPQASVSRIGSRAYYPAMAALAPQASRGVVANREGGWLAGRLSTVRLDLAQAVDAQRFAAGAGAPDAVALRTLQRAALLEAALAQPLRSTCSLQQQVVQLLAVQRGLLDDLPVEQVHTHLQQLWKRAQTECPRALEEMEDTKRLTAAAEAQLLQVLAQQCETVGQVQSS